MLSFFSIHLSYVPRQAGLRLDSNQRPIVPKTIEVTALYTTTHGDAAENRTRTYHGESVVALPIRPQHHTETEKNADG